MQKELDSYLIWFPRMQDVMQNKVTHLVSNWVEFKTGNRGNIGQIMMLFRILKTIFQTPLVSSGLV